MNFRILLARLSESNPRHLGRPIIRDLLIFLAFVFMTALMTWPWVFHLRDAVPDAGDPYAISYFMWWDYHQTFHAPLHLFDATILFPYHSTLAFGEYDYGVSLIFFPLFLFGLRPLTVYSLAAFLSFPLTGYGMFRLARTLSGTCAVAWIAGIFVAFVPFRFHHLPHLHLIFFVWTLLLFEALIMFARSSTWPRATWLGFTFLMHGLTCTTWLILAIVPLAISAALLLTRNNAWRDRNFWVRAATTLSLATVLLLPFILPLRRAAIENGFVRTPQEVTEYSARFINWLAADERFKVWRGLGAAAVNSERVLFPGLLAPLLALAAFLLPPPRKDKEIADDRVRRRTRVLLTVLDCVAVIAGALALLSLGYDVFKLSLFGRIVMRVTGPMTPLGIMFMALLIRCGMAYPEVLRRCMRGERNLIYSFGSKQRSELFEHALVWTVLGFAGSFGLSFFFHRFLYYYVPLFQGMRAATRWAMISYVGLGLLAGLGAWRLGNALSQWWPRVRAPLVATVMGVAILFELHAAPLQMIHGAVDPDAVTLDLKDRKMSGAILELPIGDGDHVYMLRAADHGHPIVNGRYSFVPPLQLEIEGLTKTRPIPDRLFDLIETIPVSYVTYHPGLMSLEDVPWVEDFLRRGVAMGRLRFIKSFPSAIDEGPNQRVNLYAVVKIESNAQGEAQKPVD